MSWFPQLGSGSVTQFPLRRTRTWRGITNELESGERITLPDLAAGQIEWRLSYQDLTDAEIKSLTDLFTGSQGRFQAFGFIDPLANLLGWSEDLSQPDWQPGLLSVAAGFNDPLGTQRAWSVTNATAGEQALAQTLAIPGSYAACFSVWMRSDSATTATLQRDGEASAVQVGPVWSMAFLSGTGAAGASSSTFSIAVLPGETLYVWGLQVEAQPYGSQYKQSAAATGIYEETYFGADEITVTNTGPGLSACDITLLSTV